jgi:hypothetical protein
MARDSAPSAVAILVLFGRSCMALFLLEALLALVILIGIVWWTMFSGRHKGELPPPESPSGPDPKDRDRP